MSYIIIPEPGFWVTHELVLQREQPDHVFLLQFIHVSGDCMARWPQSDALTFYYKNYKLTEMNNLQ